jgi:hypothetical protein
MTSLPPTARPWSTSATGSFLTLKFINLVADTDQPEETEGVGIDEFIGRPKYDGTVYRLPQ